MFDSALIVFSGLLGVVSPMTATTETPLTLQNEIKTEVVAVEQVQPEHPQCEVPQTPFAPFTGKIIGSKVRIRTKPSLDAEVVRESFSGELFGVTGETNDFYSVMPPKGMKGYIFRTYVLEGNVEADRVNVRLYPDMDASVVAQLNRGDKVHAAVSDINNKWLEINLPDTCRFYIARDYCEKQGPIEMLAQIEKQQSEANHRLNAVFLYAQTEIQKPFEAIDIDALRHKFEELYNTYRDLPDVANRAQEANALMQDIYIQKKIAFLENKGDTSVRKLELAPDHLDRLAKLGMHIQIPHEDANMATIAEATTDALGLATTLGDEEITDKMLLWQPLEQSIYHLWAATNDERTIDEFYSEDKERGMLLTGILEPYNRIGVNNLPGDYVLKNENATVAFVYSTKINLQNMVGKQVSLIGSPRPNNFFAFPAYFIHSEK